MSVLVSLADIRDGFIIAYGIIGIIFFFVAVIVTIATYGAVRGLIKSIRSVLDESLKPALDSIKGTADSVRGTTEFVGTKAVAPIIRTYGMFAGLRKGLGVLSGVSRKRKG